MTSEEWQELVADTDYEINTEYPYPIRRKGTTDIISESNRGHGYIQVNLNRRKAYKHRVVALQWVPNPDDLPEIDHINGIRDDNHIDNLRWVSRSTNMSNTTKYRSHQFNIIDELPETADNLDSYNGYEFDGLYIDYTTEKLYLFNGLRYRELTAYRRGGNIRYLVKDIEDHMRELSHRVLFG